MSFDRSLKMKILVKIIIFRGSIVGDEQSFPFSIFLT